MNLLTSIIIILLSSCFAIVWAEVSPFMPWLKRWLAKKKIWYNKPNVSQSFSGVQRFPRRIKPFDCYECMSFWTCLIASHIYGYPLIQSIGMACLCCIFSIFVWKVVLKNNPIN